jgi:hypothetical protein
MLDERPEVVTALAEAADLTDEFAEHDGPVPDWHYYRSPAFFDIEQGQVYALLGEHEPDANRRAANLLTGGLDTLPPEQRDAEWAPTATTLRDCYRRAHRLMWKIGGTGATTDLPRKATGFGRVVTAGESNARQLPPHDVASSARLDGALRRLPSTPTLPCETPP